MTDLFALFFTPVPLKQPSYSWDSWLWQQDSGVNNRYRVQMSKYNKTKEQMDRLGQKIRNACTLMPKNKCDSLSITFFFFFTSDKTGNIKILNRSPPQQSSLNDYRAAWRTPLIIYVSFLHLCHTPHKTAKPETALHLPVSLPIHLVFQR